MVDETACASAAGSFADPMPPACPETCIGTRDREGTQDAQVQRFLNMTYQHKSGRVRMSPILSTVALL